jgi:L-lysine 6-transaminase
MQVLPAPARAGLPEAARVHEILGRHLLADGYPMVLDMQASRGARLVDAATGREYLDLFTFYASNPLGMNHPALADDSPDARDFRERLMDAAINKVANSDVYTPHMARFVETFSRVGIPDALPHAFFVAGGALAVENALKAAFDWKVRMNLAAGRCTMDRPLGQQVLHFREAFHGRSGYTLSLTNTDPTKTALFPRFDWPRVSNPKRRGGDVEAREEAALDEIKAAFHERGHDIAAIILEPIQSEGGDNHFRPEFLRALRVLADENEAMLVFDEVQTGVGLTGSFWAYQTLGVEPDMVAFGKKTQVCGFLASRRIEEAEGHVFETSSRINSTWGGNLVDMVRFDRVLEVIEADDLCANVRTQGAHLKARLTALAERFDGRVTEPRGEGLLCAFDLPDKPTRDAVVDRTYELGAVILGCGTRSIRFRPALCITTDDLDAGVDVVERALADVLG